MLSLSDRLKRRLNRSMPAARDAELGTRLQEIEGFGIFAHDYGNKAVTKKVGIEELPFNPIVAVSLSNANANADLVLPLVNKLFIINNGTGKTITVKADGKAGVDVANDKVAIVMPSGEDFVEVSASS